MNSQSLLNFPPHDLCGMHLNDLVSRGHYLIAKVQKLSNQVPPCFFYDYIVRKHKFATVKDSEKKGKLSTIWKKIYSKNETKAVLRQQVSSYSHRTAASSIETQSKRNSNDQVSGTESMQKDEKFTSILIDFAYLGNPEKYDSHSHILRDEDNEEERRKKIADQEHLESEFVCEYDDCLRDYYQLFSDVLAYYQDIYRFLGDLEGGHYILYNVESLLQHQQGVKLLPELLYLYGTLLILIEMYIPGTIRERFIIAHRRYCRVNDNPAPLTTNSLAVAGVSRHSDNFEPLCKLFQRTEVDPSDHDTGILVPENYLNRMKLPSSVTEKVIECLLTQEIYEMEKRSFPSFQYFSNRLSMQACMVFIILNFEPDLFRQEDKMRQIIDRMFHDNWVVPLYNGELVDLSVEWNQRYPVAKRALGHVLTEKKIHSLNTINAKQVMLCTEEMKRYMDQNILTDLYVLEHLEKLLEWARASNRALKWRLLHKDSPLLFTDKKGSKDVSMISVVDDRDIVDLFLVVASFESTVREICLSLVKEKNNLWSGFKASAISKMQQLSSYFHGKDSLAHVEKNEKIGIWFKEMATEIQALDFTGTCDEVQFYMDSLSDIGNLHQLDSNSQIKSLILETKLELVRMVKCEEIRDDIDSVIDTISDARYARVAIEYFIPIFHSRSLKDPKSVGYLRPCFIKIASFLRQIKTSQSPNYDGDFAKHYHSETLLYFVKEILNVIPLSIFSTYAMVVDMNEESLGHLPTKVGTEPIAYSFEDHYKRAKLTFELSVLTKGNERNIVTIL
jgi:WASH complex subunit strumpellin